MHRALRRLVQVWPWVLALLVCAPLLAPGYVLSYDMVWVPDLALRPDTLGLGSALPRAVPSDALVAVLDEVVPGQLLQKVVLLGSLGVAGTGAARLWSSDAPVAALATSSLYVWNPYVAERLLLGQWPLLVGYAALPWVVVAARRLRDDGDDRAWWPLVLGLAASSLSPAGGLAALLTALAVQHGGDRPWRRTGAVLGAGLAVNATWVVSGLAVPAGGWSDPAAVELFAARGEGHLPILPSVLGLGGIWNSAVVPDSRTTVVGLLSTGVVLVVAGLGAWSLRSQRCSGRLLAVGACGLVVALLGAAVPGVLEALVDALPGAGLLRDGTRFLLLWALPLAWWFGAGVQLLARRAPRAELAAFAGVLAVIWPVASLPDLAWGVGGALRPVSYPADWLRAVEEADDAADGGDVLVLPFHAYRAPAWNDRHPVLDPAGRLLAATPVVNDDLVVAGATVEGEDPHAQLIGDALAGPDAAAALADAGISVVLVATEAGDPGTDLAALPLLWRASTVQVHLVPGPVAEPPAAGRGRILAVATAWLVTLGCVAAAAVRRVRWRRTGTAGARFGRR
jgi:hypothetical protein